MMSLNYFSSHLSGVYGVWLLIKELFKKMLMYIFMIMVTMYTMYMIISMGDFYGSDLEMHKDMTEVYSMLSMMMAFICMSMKDEFVDKLYNSYKGVKVMSSVVYSVMVLIFVYMYSYLMFKLGYEVNVGSGQGVVEEGMSNMRYMLVYMMVCTFMEEFVFSFFTYVGFMFIFKNVMEVFMKGKHRGEKCYMQNESNLNFMWVFSVSVMFTLCHEPDLLGFPQYFVPSILYCFLYLKYGFMSAWVAHGSFNFFSPYVNKLFFMF